MCPLALGQGTIRNTERVTSFFHLEYNMHSSPWWSGSQPPIQSCLEPLWCRCSSDRPMHLLDLLTSCLAGSGPPRNAAGLQLHERHGGGALLGIACIVFWLLGRSRPRQCQTSGHGVGGDLHVFVLPFACNGLMQSLPLSRKL